MHLQMSSAKWRPFCLDLNVLINNTPGKQPQTVEGVKTHTHTMTGNDLIRNTAGISSITDILAWIYRLLQGCHTD